jgi:hypothetical protein
MKTEIVCIKRYGFSILSTEGMDAAAKVTLLRYTPGEVYNPEVGVQQEWLVPLPNYWGE